MWWEPLQQPYWDSARDAVLAGCAQVNVRGSSNSVSPGREQKGGGREGREDCPSLSQQQSRDIDLFLPSDWDSHQQLSQVSGLSTQSAATLHHWLDLQLAGSRGDFSASIIAWANPSQENSAEHWLLLDLLIAPYTPSGYTGQVLKSGSKDL